MVAVDPHGMTAKEHIDEANEQLLNARAAEHGTAAMLDALGASLQDGSENIPC